MSDGEIYGYVLRSLAELQRVVANLFVAGTVHEVDAGSGTVRLKTGEENGQPILTPVIPVMEHGGAFKSLVPPRIGQTMIAIQPCGDPRQGFAICGGFSDANPPPAANEGENVWTFGPWRFVMSAEKLKVLGPKVELAGDLKVVGDVDFMQGHVISNGKHIDDTHGHVSAPPGPSGPPV